MAYNPSEMGQATCDTAPMTDADRQARIERLISEHRLHMKTVSLAAGLGETFVRDMLKRGKRPLAPNLDAIEAAIDRLLSRVPLTPLAADIKKADVPPIYRGTLPKDVPVMGTAAGSPAGKGAFRFSSSPVDIVSRPPGLANAQDVYSLYVQNDSMSPRYEAGDLLFVSPHRPPKIGDAVIIQDPLGDGVDFEGYVKILLRRTEQWVEVRQLNPEGVIRFKNTPGLKLHRVYTTADLFGI